MRFPIGPYSHLMKVVRSIAPLPYVIRTVVSVSQVTVGRALLELRAFIEAQGDLRRVFLSEMTKTVPRKTGRLQSAIMASTSINTSNIEVIPGSNPVRLSMRVEFELNWFNLDTIAPHWKYVEFGKASKGDRAVETDEVDEVDEEATEKLDLVRDAQGKPKVSKTGKFLIKIPAGKKYFRGGKPAVAGAETYIYVDPVKKKEISRQYGRKPFLVLLDAGVRAAVKDYYGEGHKVDVVTNFVRTKPTTGEFK